MPPRGVCSIPGCGRPHRARGWCGNHWKAWQRHGTPTPVPQRHNWTVAEDTALVSVPIARGGCRAVRGGLEALAAQWGLTAHACKMRRLRLLAADWKPPPKPKPPKPPKLIQVPDPGRRVASWGGVGGRGRDADRSQPRPGVEADQQFQGRERPCARCGKAFETTPARRMLCGPCFGRGDGGIET